MTITRRNKFLSLLILLTITYSPFAFSEEPAPGPESQLDSELHFSTFLGGSGEDYACSINKDDEGSLYIVTETSSSDFPTTPGAYQGSSISNGFYQLAITKIDVSGQIVYSTYLGTPHSVTRCGGAVLTSDHKLYITGWTYDADFPTTPNALQRTLNGTADIFLVILNESGSALEYSTLFGGHDYDWSLGLALDSQNRAWIVGETGAGSVAGFVAQGDFPLRNAYQNTLQGEGDGFVTLIDPSQEGADQLVYSSYLGGEGLEIARGVSLDAEGRAYVMGTTLSTTFPTRNAFQNARGGNIDAFFSIFDASQSAANSLVYSTYLGGNFKDFGGNAVLVDSDHHVYLTGVTFSSNFPTTSTAEDASCGTDGNCNLITDAFFTVLNPFVSPANQLLYSTYLGGSAYEYGLKLFAYDRSIYMSGFTASRDLEINHKHLTNFGGYDGFIAKWNLNSGTPHLVWGRVIGGTADDRISGLWVYDDLVFVIGTTASSDFPLVEPLDSTRVNQEAFLAKIQVPAEESDCSRTPPPRAPRPRPSRNHRR